MQNFGIGGKALAVIDQLFEQTLCVALMGVRRAHKTTTYCSSSGNLTTFFFPPIGFAAP